jgi:hypothetical protein
VPTDYSEFQVLDAPAWMGRTWGEKWNYFLGLFKDGFEEAARTAVRVRFPNLCPPDALDALAFERNLERGFRDTLVQYRARVHGAWETWEWAGTKKGLSDAIVAAGYETPIIFEYRDWPYTGRWWDFWVVLLPPFPWEGGEADGVWDGPGTWGDGGAWAYDIPDDDLRRLRALIKKWKPTHMHCVNAFLVWENELWDDPGNWDDGGNWQSNVSYLTI